jgi:hypothetical protein
MPALGATSCLRCGGRFGGHTCGAKCVAWRGVLGRHPNSPQIQTTKIVTYARQCRDKVLALVRCVCTLYSRQEKKGEDIILHTPTLMGDVVPHAHTSIRSELTEAWLV